MAHCMVGLCDLVWWWTAPRHSFFLVRFSLYFWSVYWNFYMVKKVLIDVWCSVTSLFQKFEVRMVSGVLEFLKFQLLHGVCCFGTLGSDDLELLVLGILAFLLVVFGDFWHSGGVWRFGLVVLYVFWTLDFCLFFSML